LPRRSETFTPAFLPIAAMMLETVSVRLAFPDWALNLTE
jgi:hypothetical protein